MTPNSITMSADTLLGIPATRPELLLPLDEANARQVWRRLAADWHPDRNSNPRAGDVFRHLKALRDAAQDRRRDGIWIGTKTLTLTDRNGRSSTHDHVAQADTELGERLIGRRRFIELYTAEARDLMDTARERLAGLRFADTAMQQEMQGWLPKLRSSHATPGGLGALLVGKRSDQVLLSDLLAKQGGALDPRHVGWILNGMLHVACYLEWLGLTHNAIGPETWLVSPARHSGMLVAGWGYSAPVNNALVAAPARSLSVAPSVLMRSKLATHALDRELIKLTGRELLGDGTGMDFAPGVPTALADWVRQPPTANAITEYRGWQDALRQSFGPPRFVEMPVEPQDIYPKLIEKE